MTGGEMSERTAMTDVVWSAREAFACALCWSGFTLPPKRADTPEVYWLSLPEQTRNEYRREARKLLLVPIARGDAVAILPPGSWSDGQLALLGEHAKLTAKHRIWQIITAVWNASKVQTR